MAEAQTITPAEPPPKRGHDLSGLTIGEALDLRDSVHTLAQIAANFSGQSHFRDPRYAGGYIFNRPGEILDDVLTDLLSLDDRLVDLIKTSTSPTNEIDRDRRLRILIQVEMEEDAFLVAKKIGLVG